MTCRVVVVRAFAPVEDVAPLALVAVPLVAVDPLAGAVPREDAVPLVVVIPRVVVPRAPTRGAGPPLVGGGLTDLLRLAAVGLLSRSETPGPVIGLRTGVGGGDDALRDLASEAAVGANSPEAGVFGRVVCAGVVTEEGVFGRVTGVFARAGA